MQEDELEGSEFADLKVEFTPLGLGKLMFTRQEIELILNENPDSIDEQIKAGQLITQAEMRVVVVRQAKNGSSESQKMVETWRMEIHMNQAL